MKAQGPQEALFEVPEQPARDGTMYLGRGNPLCVTCAQAIGTVHVKAHDALGACVWCERRTSLRVVSMVRSGTPAPDFSRLLTQTSCQRCSGVMRKRHGVWVCNLCGQTDGRELHTRRSSRD